MDRYASLKLMAITVAICAVMQCDVNWMDLRLISMYCVLCTMQRFVLWVVTCVVRTE